MEKEMINIPALKACPWCGHRPKLSLRTDKHILTISLGCSSSPIKECPFSKGREVLIDCRKNFPKNFTEVLNNLLIAWNIRPQSSAVKGEKPGFVYCDECDEQVHYKDLYVRAEDEHICMKCWVRVHGPLNKWQKVRWSFAKFLYSLTGSHTPLKKREK